MRFNSIFSFSKDKLHSGNNANIGNKKYSLNKKVIIDAESIGNSYNSFLIAESHTVTPFITSYRKKVSSKWSNSSNQLSSQKSYATNETLLFLSRPSNNILVNIINMKNPPQLELNNE